MIEVKEILEIIQAIHPETMVSEDMDLFDTGYVDSFVIFSELLPTLMEKFNIDVLPTDLMPENFSTVLAITAFINSKKQ